MKEYYTKLQNILMGFIHISYKLLKETVGKAFLNGRCVQFQVLKTSEIRSKSIFMCAEGIRLVLLLLMPFSLVIINCLFT